MARFCEKKHYSLYMPGNPHKTQAQRAVGKKDQGGFGERPDLFTFLSDPGVPGVRSMGPV